MLELKPYSRRISLGVFYSSWGKACHLPIELESRAYWALRRCNTILDDAGKARKLQIMELEELRADAYGNAKIFKAKVKRLHDKHITSHSYSVGDKVLLYNSKLHIFPGKLKSRWTGPYTITSVGNHGTFEIINPSKENATSFKVNGYRLKPFYDNAYIPVEKTQLAEPNFE